MPIYGNPVFTIDKPASFRPRASHFATALPATITDRQGLREGS
jgi:hypothetical protein